MADPRADVKFDEIGRVVATFKVNATNIVYSASQVNGSAQVGRAVTMGAASKVDLVGDAEPVIGKLLEVYSDNFGAVQVGGFMTLPGGTGASLTLGRKIVGDTVGSTEGYIREAANSASELIYANGEIIDASDTTAVVVRL